MFGYKSKAQKRREKILTKDLCVHYVAISVATEHGSSLEGVLNKQTNNKGERL